jgi:hypothetical protein
MTPDRDKAIAEAPGGFIRQAAEPADKSQARGEQNAWRPC